MQLPMNQLPLRCALPAQRLDKIYADNETEKDADSNIDTDADKMMLTMKICTRLTSFKNWPWLASTSRPANLNCLYI